MTLPTIHELEAPPCSPWPPAGNARCREIWYTLDTHRRPKTAHMCGHIANHDRHVCVGCGRRRRAGMTLARLAPKTVLSPTLASFARKTGGGRNR